MVALSMEIQKPVRRRRHHSEEFKQAVIEACLEPGASVAGISMSNGVNANQVRRWMRERGIEAPNQRILMPAAQPAPSTATEFVQLPFTPESGDIRIEIQRGNTALKIDWPVQAASDCAAWLRDWLR